MEKMITLGSYVESQNNDSLNNFFAENDFIFDEKTLFAYNEKENRQKLLFRENNYEYPFIEMPVNIEAVELLSSPNF